MSTEHLARRNQCFRHSTCATVSTGSARCCIAEILTIAIPHPFPHPVDTHPIRGTAPALTVRPTRRVWVVLLPAWPFATTSFAIIPAMFGYSGLSASSILISALHLKQGCSPPVLIASSRFPKTDPMRRVYTYTVEQQEHSHILCSKRSQLRTLPSILRSRTRAIRRRLSHAMICSYPKRDVAVLARGHRPMRSSTRDGGVCGPLIPELWTCSHRTAVAIITPPPTSPNKSVARLPLF